VSAACALSSSFIRVYLWLVFKSRQFACGLAASAVSLRSAVACFGCGWFDCCGDCPMVTVDARRDIAGDENETQNEQSFVTRAAAYV